MRLLYVLYMAFTDHTFNIHPYLVPAHTHTPLVLTPVTHTYNILPCFESICGSAQSPLHKLFVTTERARGLLLWWLSEKTQKTTLMSLSSYTVYGLNLTPKAQTLRLFQPTKNTYAHTQPLWMDQTAHVQHTKTLLQGQTSRHCA